MKPALAGKEAGDDHSRHLLSYSMKFEAGISELETLPIVKENSLLAHFYPLRKQAHLFHIIVNDYLH